MTDREFIKVNTSIQTASNSATLKADEEGKIPAVIELRLPDNLFSSQVGNKNVDSVSMLTTKLRLSLMETPVAQVPLDVDLTRKSQTNVSTCKIDVFPYIVDDDGSIKPDEASANLAFPEYKNHELTYYFRVAVDPINDPDSFVDLSDVVYTRSNDIFNEFPTTSRFYDLIKSNNLFGNHLLNMVIPSSHEKLMIENDAIMVRSVSTLEQMWMDALENAVAYACTGSKQDVMITLIDVTSITPDISPRPNTLVRVHIDELDKDVCFWYREITNTEENKTASYACKPDVTIGEQSFKIAYDTIPFDYITPVLWSNSFVDTYEIPPQESLDYYRNEILHMPPPKRVYKYGVMTNDEGSVSQAEMSYYYTLRNPLDSRVFNIIANQATKDLFAFLPWTTVSAESLTQNMVTSDMYKIERDITETETYEVITKNCSFITSGSFQSFKMHYAPLNTSSLHFAYSAGAEILNDLYDYRPLEIPQYLANYLTTNYPIATPAQNGDIVMAVDFYFPEDDPAYEDSHFVRNTDPTMRIKQMVILPMPVETDLTSFQLGRAQTTTPFNNLEYTQYSNTSDKNGPSEIVISKEPQIPGKNINSVRHTTTQIGPTTETDVPFNDVKNSIYGNLTIDNTTEWIDVDWDLPELGLVYTNYPAFYINPSDGNYNLGVPRRGKWKLQCGLENQYTYPPEPIVRSFFGRIAFQTYQCLPPFNPDDELLSNDPDDFIMYNGKKYLHGCLIWYLYRNAVEPWDHQEYCRLSYIPNGQTTTTKMYEIITSGVEIVDETNYDFVTKIGEYTSSDHVPNILSVKDETLYILNGTSASCNIGQQEIIQKNNDIFDITSTSTTKRRSRTGTYTIRYNDTHDEQQVLHSKEEKLLAYTESGYIDSIEIAGNTYHSFIVIEEVYTPGSMQEYRYYSSLERGLARPQLSNDVYSPAEITSESWGLWVRTILPPVISNFHSSDMQYASSVGQTSEHTFPPVTTKIPTVTGSSTEETLPYFVSLNRETGQYVKLQGVIDSSKGNKLVPATSPNEVIVKEYPPPPAATEYIVTSYYYILLDQDEQANYFHDINPIHIDIISEQQIVDQVTVVDEVELVTQEYEGNVRLTYEWDNIPTVVMSPIQSFVLLLNGMNVNQEVHPINIAQPGSSSLVSTIPIIENYFSMASTLRDLHDELVIVKDTYSDSAFYKLDTTSGQERSITLTVKYITKDGRLHQVYIPSTGVYTLQLTFGISFYLS